MLINLHKRAFKIYACDFWVVTPFYTNFVSDAIASYIKIADLTGQKLLMKPISADEHLHFIQIDLLKPGVYILELLNENQIRLELGKVIVIR